MLFTQTTVTSGEGQRKEEGQEKQQNGHTKDI
jgi:hypothetical protein